jgi:hypothetical protein
MRLYVESYGATVGSLSVPVDTSAMEVLRMMRGVTFRGPTRFEAACEWITDALPGRVVSADMREDHGAEPPDWLDWD